MHCDVQIYCEIFATAFMSATVDLHPQKTEHQSQMQTRKEPRHVSLLSVDSPTIKYILFYFCFDLCADY
jgi:hypothetical protein